MQFSRPIASDYHHLDSAVITITLQQIPPVEIGPSVIPVDGETHSLTSFVAPQIDNGVKEASNERQRHLRIYDLWSAVRSVGQAGDAVSVGCAWSARLRVR